MNSPDVGDGSSNDREKPQRRPTRTLRDLASLFDKVDQTSTPVSINKQEDLSLPQLTQSEEASEMAELSIPPDLEKFISPDLWRKVNSHSPPRGVLMNALDRVRSVFNLLSIYLPNHLVQEKMRRPVPGLVNGQILKGTLLFSDVSGFTALSERLQVLGPIGAERLTEIMNRYFTRMLEILSWSGGILLKFAGDANLVYFPEQRNNGQANWAVRAAQRMLFAIADFSDIETPSGKVSLRMKVGVATGEFLAASVGSAKRMEYVVLGPAVAQTMGAEGATTAAGQLVVNTLTASYLTGGVSVKEHKSGYFLVNPEGGQPLDDFELKGEARRVRGAMPWSASPQDILTQIEETLCQIYAVQPYLSPELVDRIIVRGQRSIFNSLFRPAAVMFCNFWGPEALLAAWDRVGVSRVTSLLSAYFNAVNETVNRYGGIVSRIDPYSKGTKMLILFGAPVAHEDDPQRAISAALSMNAALENLNETWRRKFARHLPSTWTGPLMQHRIGITSGDTFAGQVGSPTRREYTVMGDDVNLAARLMGAAEPGQILLHLEPEVHADVETYFWLTPRPPIRVKGKSKLIPIDQVEAPRDDLLANRARKRGQWVGREAELAQAEAVLHQALAGKGALLVLQGAPGIGKSHLADELTKRAKAGGARVFFSQCHSYTAHTSYAVWGALLRSLAGITSVDIQPQIHHQKLQQLIANLELAPQYVLPLATLMGLKSIEQPRKSQKAEAEPVSSQESADPLLDLIRNGKTKRRGSQLDVWNQIEDVQRSETGQIWQITSAYLSVQDQQETYEAVWQFLTGLTRMGPVVLFFEDAHWMDAQTRDLLKSISTRIERLPLLLLFAQREIEEKIDFEKNQILSLTPLALGETSALVAHLLISDLAQVIHDQSQGNPLFVEEITHWFQRTHDISASELRNVLQTSNFLQKLVLSELESLPEEQREIAMLAAIIGPEFHTSEVQSLLPASIDPVTLSNHLRSLARTRLISLAEVGADARYHFQQNLVRDVLYNSLPFEKRGELHGKLADFLNGPLSRRRALQAKLAMILDSSQVVDPAQEAETVAYHYEQAGRWVDAAQCLLMAGEHSKTQKAYANAARDYARALSDLEKPRPAEGQVDPALKFRLLLGQGDAAVMVGDFLAATTAYEAARSSLAPVETPEEVIPLTYRLALVLPTQRRTEEAEAQLCTILEKWKQANSVEILAVMAWLTWRAGKASAQDWMERCEALLPRAERTWAARMRALLASWRRQWAVAREWYQTLDNLAGVVYATIRTGDQLLQNGDVAGALVAYQQAVEACQIEWEDLYYCLALAMYRQAEIYWRTGDVDEARSILQKSGAVLEKVSVGLAAEGRSATQQALKMLGRSRSKNWPEWPLLNFEDRLWVRMLFQIK
jgi:class 3 adenylate cyclase/tetratricopeptide (TPR) repeat protein